MGLRNCANPYSRAYLLPNFSGFRCLIKTAAATAKSERASLILLSDMTINRFDQVRVLDTTYIPITKAFTCLTAVVDDGKCLKTTCWPNFWLT